MLSVSVNNNEKELLMTGTSFPLRLHTFLRLVDELDIANVVSWQPHGRCFRIHDTKEFVKLNNPRYVYGMNPLYDRVRNWLLTATLLYLHCSVSWFIYSKYSSLQRQLNIYGFQRIPDGVDKNCYYHKYFLRGHPNLLQKIKRVPVKKNVPGHSLSSHVPDFYSMPPLTESTSTTRDDKKAKVQTSSVAATSQMKCSAGRTEPMNVVSDLSMLVKNQIDLRHSAPDMNFDKNPVDLLVNNLLDFGARKYPLSMGVSEGTLQMMERSRCYDLTVPIQSSMLSSFGSTADSYLELLQTLSNLRDYENSTTLFSTAPRQDPFLPQLVPRMTTTLASLEAQAKYESIINTAIMLNVRKQQHTVSSIRH
jgi:hypothetical protein